jgi:hypothetical protein
MFSFEYKLIFMEYPKSITLYFFFITIKLNHNISRLNVSVQIIHSLHFSKKSDHLFSEIP